jgi:hypothetical protein
MSAARKLGRRQARELDVTLVARLHATHCRAPFGVPCTCTPTLALAGHATTEDDAKAMIGDHLRRRDAIMAEIERGFS